MTFKICFPGFTRCVSSSSVYADFAHLLRVRDSVFWFIMTSTFFDNAFHFALIVILVGAALSASAFSFKNWIVSEPERFFFWFVFDIYSLAKLFCLVNLCRLCSFNTCTLFTQYPYISLLLFANLSFNFYNNSKTSYYFI